MNPFKRLFQRKAEQKKAVEEMAKFSAAAKNFADEYPESFVLLADPGTDVIFMTYGGIVAPVRVLNKDGSRNHIVVNALKHTRGDADIDRFLLAVDGGLFAIAKALYNNRRASLVGKVIDFVAGTPPMPNESKVSLADGSVLSPVQVQ